ncbi:unnamed protein product [Phytophthora fragariaefolia]|uniref:Unnamed protein product n=1 Tax=Phytophthora fragariaefolia TaxID=1490495 RepID=A0A9W7CW79_9STRA|nr:unnamed protein product [Phytophthora fragariaefolia]
MGTTDCNGYTTALTSSTSNPIMNLRSLVFTVLAATIFTSAEAVSIGHDKVQPFPQPEPVTISEKAAVKHKPSLQIINGCHPYPAVNAAGETSTGLKGSGRPDGNCKGSGLGSQVYGRAVWYKNLWAIMYAWYFPKDRYEFIFGWGGHRHNWVNAIVWLDNPSLENPTILAVSTWNLMEGYDLLNNAPPQCHRYHCNPEFTAYINSSSPMVSYEYYYQEPSWHTLRMTPTMSVGEPQDLIMWEQLSEPARVALSETDFEEKAKVPFIDANFNASLEAARPFL